MDLDLLSLFPFFLYFCLLRHDLSLASLPVSGDDKKQSELQLAQGTVLLAAPTTLSFGMPLLGTERKRSELGTWELNTLACLYSAPSLSHSTGSQWARAACQSLHEVLGVQ